MPNFNPDEIYHKASHGRVQNTTSETESYDQIHFVSAEVKGSAESELSKKNIREATAIRLDDKLLMVIMVGGILAGAFTFLSRMIGSFFPFYGFALGATLFFIAAFIVYYVIRQIKFKVENKKYKEFKKREDAKYKTP